MADKPIFDHIVTGWDNDTCTVQSTYVDRNGNINYQTQWGYDGNGDPQDPNGRDRNNHSTLHPSGDISHI